jgi:hypothetical protein
VTPVLHHLADALHYLAGLELLHPARAIATVHALAAGTVACLAYGLTPEGEQQCPTP